MRQILTASAAVCALAFAHPVHAARLSATPATFLAQIKAYACGDTIVQAPGRYGEGLTGVGLRFSTKDCPADKPLTIKGQPGAVFVSGILMDKAQAVVFDRVEITHNAASGHVFRTYAARDLTITNSFIHGQLTATGGRKSDGVKVDGGTNAKITRNRIEDVANGVTTGATANLNVSDNDIRALASDGINVGGILGGAITGNHIWDFYVPAGAHADGVQIQPNATRATTDLVIDDNLIENALGGPNSQGIFGGAGKGAPFQRVKVRNNLTLNVHYRAVSLDGTQGLVVSGNRTLYQPHPDARLKPWVVATNSADADVSGNASMNFILDGTKPMARPKAAASNTKIDFATAAQIDAARADWLEEHRGAKSDRRPATPRPRT